MKRKGLSGFYGFCLCIVFSILFSSCTRLLGWGVLLWSVDDPAIPSGTVLPVYIRSNIDQVWVVGIPDEYRESEDSIDKFELPLWQLNFSKNKKDALEQAEAFTEYAKQYAETIQDGLPIREEPDNSARRVYRLRQGQIIKILSLSTGNPAISAAGTPLPGDWYRVLTEDGTTGYCFSYRLRLFEHTGGPLMVTQTVAEETEDKDLELVFSKTWYPESYSTMVSRGRIDLNDLSKKWSFSPGQDSGIAHIYLSNLDRSFPYTSIRRTGNRAWVFEGTNLQMNLRSDTTLAVQFSENGGTQRTLLFVALPGDVDDLIDQETERRKTQFDGIYSQGPVFQSANYGTLVFTEDGKFTWTGFNLLSPSVIPPSVPGTGTIDMGIYLTGSLQNQYTGALTLRFDGAGSRGPSLNFMYVLDSQGLRLEHAPDSVMDGITVVRRASSPLVIYFYIPGR
ncbi:SH3 domain-containing protein [Breznakiella homolactica]|uniref:SH3 domain-containing protein n=1 Tax=Breznakiella homolactica TaxID=2798577 RepID=A0A7T7XMU8_9SPIR|nr:SH3 domain-containing protein [Breznakiella homolactica]QQO09264.1 SH3 domain-containing protein [Breznakiella homolactica]